MARHIASLIDSAIREYCEQNIIQGRDVDSLTVHLPTPLQGNPNPVPNDTFDLFCELSLTPSPNDAVDRMVEVVLTTKVAVQLAQVLNAKSAVEVIIVDYGDLDKNDINRIGKDITAGRDAIQKEFIDNSEEGIAIYAMPVLDDQEPQEALTTYINKASGADHA